MSRWLRCLPCGLVAGVSLTALTACNNPVRPRDPGTYTVLPSAQWSGGALTVTSPSFRNGAQTARFIVNGDTVAAVRAGDSAFAFLLPIGPSGQLRITALMSGGADEVGTVQRVGLRTSVPLGTPLYAGLSAGQGPTGPVVLAQDYYTWQLRALSLRSGSWLNTGPLNTTAYQTSASYLSDAYLLTDTVAAVTGLWRLTSAGFALQSAFWLNGWTGGVTVVPSPGLVVWCPAFPGWEVTQVHFASGDPYRSYSGSCRRAVYETGAPVVLLAPSGLAIEANSGDSLYTFASRSTDGTMRLVRAGSYTATRDELIIASYVPVRYNLPPPPPDSLHRIDPGRGTVKAQASTSIQVLDGGIAPDPDGQRLYVAGVAKDTTLQVLVYDPATLALLGVLPTGDSCANGSYDCYGVVVSVDPAYQRVDLVLPGGTSAHLHTFDRLP